MGRVIWVFLLILSTMTLVGVASASEPEDDAADSDVQDLVFFGRERPLFFRLRLQRDGKSFRAAWREFGDMLFREFDADKDGVLSGKEWDVIPSPDLLVIGNPRGVPQGAESVGVNIDVDPQDGRVTPAEFAEYLLRVGAGPFSMQAERGQLNSSNPVRAGGAGDVRSSLFQRFDSDGDGKLSLRELAGGAEVLRRFDRDEDELVTPAELDFPNSPYAVTRASTTTGFTTQFYEITPGNKLDGVINKLISDLGHMERAGKDEAAINREPLIPIEQLGLPPALVAPFDSDANKELDKRELHRLLRHGAWLVEVTIRSGTVPAGKSRVEVSVREGLSDAIVRPIADGAISLVLPGLEFEFGADPTSSASALMRVLQLFKSADADNNGYLERKETTRNPFFGQAFDSLDADGDGKLFESEVKTYIESREAAARSRTALTIQLQSNNFFNMLDTNQDGRLGLRELLEASRRASAWDRDGDAYIAADEVPQLYNLKVGREQPQLPGMVNVVRARPTPTSAAPDLRRGPEWFRRMDKNRDGDVSRREFLGPRELFDRLDANHDGLVSADEAEGKP